MTAMNVMFSTIFFVLLSTTPTVAWQVFVAFALRGVLDTFGKQEVPSDFFWADPTSQVLRAVADRLNAPDVGTHIKYRISAGLPDERNLCSSSIRFSAARYYISCIAWAPAFSCKTRTCNP